MAEDVALFELEDGAVQKVKVGSAYRCAGYFEDDVAGLDDLGLGRVDCVGE